MDNENGPSARGEAVTIDQVGVVGLGLIGGSIARALKTRAGVRRVIGMDRKPEVLAAARADGAIDHGVRIVPPAPDGGDDCFAALAACDLVFLCTPVETLPSLAARVVAHCAGIVTDAGSVKQPVLRALGHLPRFVGGHPMAGSERTGYGCSAADLLEGATYVLCAPADGDAAARTRRARDVDALAALVTRLGALPMRMTAAEHDHAVATISHLPHAVASALTVLASEQDGGTLSALAAGGFKDITRIASAPPALWTGICLQSAPALIPLLDAYREVLDRFRGAIAGVDAEALHTLFAAGAAYRAGLPSIGRGALDAHTTLNVQIPDQPGALARVAGLLGDHGINIRNLDITNVRSYESGVLRVLLEDSRQQAAAARVLTEAGYDCER